ncbi:hypothetical protein [Moheibacter stercoris]|uniref:Uncharacterized protein n=1 Tax=Moheibacter stercoris TaxID=1628251 RepID=A0ABV2LWP2_9FLAO
MDGRITSMNKDKLFQMPIMVKAMEIQELVSALRVFYEEAEVDENSPLEMQLDMIHENSLIIPAKIAGAEGGDIYDIRMENAAIIRKAAREISVTLGYLDLGRLEENEYTDLIRLEIENFKVLFREWLKTFDPWNYVLDDWGLFNPPGIDYEDEDE